MSLKLNISTTTKKCRLCLRRAEAFINLFQGNFKQIIQDLTSIKISQDDAYPKIACINCIDEVQQANKTRKRILECHNKLIEMDRQNVETDPLKELKDPDYPEVVLVDEFSDDEMMHTRESSPDLEDVLATYGEFVDDEDEDYKEITDDNNTDMPFLKFENGDVEHEDDKDMLKLDFKKSLKEPAISTRQSRYIKKPETEKKQYRCEECNMDFQRNRRSWSVHMMKHKKSQCKICGIVIRADNMSKHVECHLGGTRVCDLCGKTCKNIESLRGHIFYMHRKTADQYKCDQCDRSFRMKYKLEQHKTKEHIGIRSHTCTTCKKSFFTQRDMNRHIQMTHLKLRPHVCPHCSRGFSSKYAMKTHVRQHTNETPYKCYVCAEGFRQNVSLRTHLKSKHNIEEDKKFPCEICEKAFSSDFALKVHLRLHGDDNFRCILCEESFVQKIFLINHLKNVHEIGEDTIQTMVSSNEAQKHNGESGNEQE